METATIIVSRDFQFVSFVINHLKDDLFHSTIERSIGSDDFEVLLNELIDENLRIISVICDSNLSLNDLNEIRKVIKNMIRRYITVWYLAFKPKTFTWVNN